MIGLNGTLAAWPGALLIAYGLIAVSLSVLNRDNLGSLFRESIQRLVQTTTLAGGPPSNSLQELRINPSVVPEVTSETVGRDADNLALLLRGVLEREMRFGQGAYRSIDVDEELAKAVAQQRKAAAALLIMAGTQGSRAAD